MIRVWLIISLSLVALSLGDGTAAFARSGRPQSAVACFIDGILRPVFGFSSQSPIGRLKLIRKEGRSGAWYRDQAGVRWYLKPDEKYLELQTAAEIITSSLYRKLGYDAAEAHIVYIQGKRYSAAREIVGGAHVRDFTKLNTPEFRKLRFHAAYLQDWDRTVGTNIILHESGDMSLIDFGGSLGSRAQGKPKPGIVDSSAIGTFKPSRSIDELMDGFDIEALSESHPWRARSGRWLSCTERAQRVPTTGRGP